MLVHYLYNEYKTSTKAVIFLGHLQREDGINFEQVVRIDLHLQE